MLTRDFIPYVYHYLYYLFKRLLNNNSFSGLANDELGRSCFKGIIVPLLNKTADFLKLGVKSILDIYEIIELLFKKQTNSEYFNKYEQLVKQMNSDQLSMLLIETTTHFDTYKSSKTFYKLYEWRMETLSQKMRKQPEFSWSMSSAKLPKHLDVQKFLRSAEQTYTYKNSFGGIADARKFIEEYDGLRKELGFSIATKAYGIGKKAHVIITKTRDFYNSQTQDADIKQEYDALQEKFESFSVKTK